MMTEELAFVSLEGESVRYSHAVLIETEKGGWHVELEGVPVDSCPFTEGPCRVDLATWDGEHFAGVATTSYTSAGDDTTYVVLSGDGELVRTADEDGPVRDAEDAPPA